MSTPWLGGRYGILAVGVLSLVAAGSRLEAPPAQPPAQPPAGPPAPTAATRAAGVDERWWRRTSAALERQEYEATPGEHGLQAPNRAQNLRTLFRPQGIEVRPRQGSRVAWPTLQAAGGGLRLASPERAATPSATPAWRFGWETTALGRPGTMVDAAPSTPRADGARVTYVRPGWTEWYENTPAGLEQGFTIDRRPPGEGPLSIAGTIRGGVEGKLAAGAVEFCDEQGAPVLHYGHLVAYDAEGRVLPSRLSLKEQGLVIAVDDAGASYPITIDPLMTSPAWTVEGNQTFAHLGSAAATAGDVNADGFSDVVVGAYGYDNGEEDEGRAFLFLGSPAGLSASPAWTAESNQADADFGYSAAATGDVNGDGFGDVVIGARSRTQTEGSEGRALVYHGSPGGLSSTPAWTFDGGENSAGFGSSVAGAGDVNGDGYADVVVGAPWHDGPGSTAGRAYVFHGSAAGLAATPAWTTAGDQIEAHHGQAVAGAGDVNGDGYADVIVGADGYTNGEDGEGRAYVYLGSPGGLATTPVWTAESNQAHCLFAWSVATAGDVNGDGYAEVIVGSPQYDQTPGDNAGRAFVYYGSAAGPAASPGWTNWCLQAFAWYGISVGTAGDVNGDGFPEVIVGASFYDNGEEDEGAAFVYPGFAAGLATTPFWVGETNRIQGGYFDWQFPVGTAGDVNGDGFSDVLFGASMYSNGEVYEGRAFAFHGGGDGLGTFPAWFTNGGQAGAGWGWSVATAGDVNGDGYSDIIAVADRYDNGQVDEGKAWVYHGTPAGAASVPAWSAETNQASAQISAAASAGDVNGDGYSDVIIGSYLFDGGQSNEGRTFLYLGSESGLLASPSWTSEPDQASAWFGYSAASAGDVNGDGYGDVIVGADGWDNEDISEGRAWLYLGSSGGLGAPAWSVEGNQEGAHLGSSVATAGDVNGDGFSDVLIALPAYDNGESNEGVVWVFHGSDGGIGASPSRVIEANQTDASFGTRVATAGDVNGDGFSDVIVGATGYDGGQQEEGKAFVYHGGATGLAALAAWTTESDQALAQLGWAVATAGDLNGDGYSDVVVGAHFYDNGENNEGKVWVYHGSPAGLGAPVWSTEGGQAGAVYGISVGTAGDVNGDGFSDLIVSAADYDYAFNGEGAVWIFLGNSSDGLHRTRRQLRTDQLVPIDILGRSDSETAVRLQALARSPMGRGRVRLEIEMKRAGIPFDGTGLVTSAYMNTGAPGANGSAITLLQNVSGLWPGTLYHWRLRIASESPLFPHSPWLWLPGNAVSEGDVRTGGEAGGLVADAPPPAAGQWLGRAAPNPFTSTTELAYTLPQRARARVAVYDVQGRLVVTVVDGMHAAGHHDVRWDGRDANGNLLAAGVYFVRLESAGRMESEKIVRHP